MRHAPLPFDFAAPSSEIVARLIGVTLLVDGVGGRIVETEAYDREDPASHSFPGRRRATRDVRPAGARLRLPLLRHPLVPELRLPGGGHGAGVLIRAIEPRDGLDAMRERRGMRDAGCCVRTRASYARRWA